MLVNGGNGLGPPQARQAAIARNAISAKAPALLNTLRLEGGLLASDGLDEDMRAIRINDLEGVEVRHRNSCNQG
jgi:hypothetical protein